MSIKEIILSVSDKEVECVNEICEKYSIQSITTKPMNMIAFD